MFGHTSDSSLVNAIVTITGIGYFTAWSISFYPQIILNYRRKKTTGLSADMIILNPVGFLALTIWNWGMYFSPLARKQYRDRHDGHSPQISIADLAFSLHACIISTLTLIQVIYYAWKNGQPRGPTFPTETQTLLHNEVTARTGEGDPIPVKRRSTIRPSKGMKFALVGIFFSSLISGTFVWIGFGIWLDWLYFVSTIKLIISLIKYIPQVHLNYTLKSAEGLAIGVILLDLTGSFLSFVQLVVSSIYVEHDPTGIIANPAKLGLSLLSVSFDIILIFQNYYLYPKKKVDSDDEDEDEA